MTGNFSGIFSSVTGKGDFLNEIKVGTRFFGGFTYYTDASIVFGGGSNVIYDGSGFKIWLNIVGEHEMFRLYDTGAGGINISNNSQWGDVFLIPFIMGWRGDIAGYFPDEAQIQLSDSTGAVFDDASLPTTLNLRDFDEGRFWIANLGNPETPFQLFGSFETFNMSPVPEPSTMLLLGSGLLGLLGLRKKFKK